MLGTVGGSSDSCGVKGSGVKGSGVKGSGGGNRLRNSSRV